MGILKRCMPALLLTTLALAGCASKEVPFDHSRAADIKTIGIVTPYFPDGPMIKLVTSAGQSFGLMGALVDAGMLLNRSNHFLTMLHQHNIDPEAALLSSLIHSLREHGYNVVAVPAKHPDNTYLDEYPDPASLADPKPDAYLDMIVDGYGYMAAGIAKDAPYRPALGVKVRLVRASPQHQLLMQDAVWYNVVYLNGNPSASLKAITLTPEPQYAFATFDDMMADPDTTIKGMQASFDDTSAAIATLLQ